MSLLPKFLREFPSKISSVLAGDLLPISSDNEDDSYKVTALKFRDDTLKLPWLGLNKPYIYGNSHYTAGIGTISHDVTHGTKALVCSSSTDFDAIMPGYLLRVTEPQVMYRTVIKKHYTDQYLEVEATVQGWSSSFSYSNPRLAALNTSNDSWRPTGTATLMGLIHENTYFNYEPVSSSQLLAWGVPGAPIPVPFNTITQIRFGNVEYNNFGEWKTENYHMPLYNGLYRLDLHFQLFLIQYTPGAAIQVMFAPYPYSEGQPAKFFFQSYAPSSMQGDVLTINCSTVATLPANQSHAWYIFTTVDSARIEDDMMCSIKRERSIIGAS